MQNCIVATAGKFTDYIQDLIRLAIEDGLDVWVLTGYEMHGINIWIWRCKDQDKELWE